MSMIDTLYRRLLDAVEDDDFTNGDDHEVMYLECDDDLPPHTFVVTMDNAAEGTRDFKVTITKVAV